MTDFNVGDRFRVSPGAMCGGFTTVGLAVGQTGVIEWVADSDSEVPLYKTRPDIPGPDAGTDAWPWFFEWEIEKIGVDDE